jgi:polyisoprenoid-binding protein YceI
MNNRRLATMATNFAAALLMAAVVPAALAEAATFVVTPGADGNEVVFESKATLESFKGKTDRVSGSITADLSDLAGPIDVRITVDLASFDTGIGKRNSHMRDNHLETDLYPEAVFTADRIVKTSAPALAAGRTVIVHLAGTMALHGVVRDVEYETELKLAAGNTLLVAAEFTVSLEDHGIKRPKFLVMKLADEQKITVKLEATPE